MRRIVHVGNSSFEAGGSNLVHKLCKVRLNSTKLPSFIFNFISRDSGGTHEQSTVPYTLQLAAANRPIKKLNG
jgi:hypothetical protein